MIESAYILAAGGDSDWSKYVVVLVVAAIATIRALAAWAKKKREEQEAQRTNRTPRQERTVPPPVPQAGAGEPPPVRRYRPIEPQNRPATARPGIRATQARPGTSSASFEKAHGQDAQTVTPPPIPQVRPRRVPVPAQGAAEEHVRTVRDDVDLDQVDEEVIHMQQEIERKLATRQQRMQTTAPSEADTAAIDARISHFKRMEQTREQVARVIVDLKGRNALRAAIIYHEILSPPKALRQGPEMWDVG